MRVVISDTQPWVPKWNGNRDLPAGEQIVGEYRDLTVAERNRFMNFDITTEVLDDKGLGTDDDDDDQERQKKQTISPKLDGEGLVTASMVKIKNCSYVVGDKETTITTGEELCNAPQQLDGLYQEALRFLMRRAQIMRAKAKNSA